MARGPKTTQNRAELDLSAEETLSFDHSRWSAFRDGVGERENGVDEQGFSIELLRLRKELSPLALALTDRILRLIDFDRPGATRALRVDQDENSPRLLLVSERAPGFRLSELLERGAERGVIADLGAALFIMRRLLTIAAAIQRETAVTHLAIAPERIVITPRGGPVIVEAALAGAVEALGDRMPPQVRKAIRLARLETNNDAAHLDVARIALAGMAMMVGRPLDPAEEVDPLSPVVQEVVDVAALRAGDLFAAALTPWLDRAITVDPQLSFETFAEAAEALEGIVPPPEARCSISRASVRKFLQDLSVDESLRSHLAALEEDRIREIRARQVRRAPALAALASSLPEAPDVVDEVDPAAAIMDMPIAVEELSSEILKQPLVIDDQPSPIVDMMVEATSDELGDVSIELVREDQISEQLDDPLQALELISIDDSLVLEEDLPVVAEELTVLEDAPVIFDEPATTSDEPATTYAEPTDEELLHFDEPDLSSEPTPESAGPTLDDLVDEILRRSSDSDLPELPTGDELLAEDSSATVGEYEAITDDSIVLEEPPVEEPPADEPPVEEPPEEEPPAYEPPPYEPPAQEPPSDDSPIEEPATRVSDLWREDRVEESEVEETPEIEEPVEEPAPIWMRAAIEQVARSRQDRPAAPPPQARSQPRDPVFELPADEPERELQPETTTLSDIAKELGLTIDRPDEIPAERSWEEARPTDPLPPDESIDDDTGWDVDIRRALLGNEHASAPVPPSPTPSPAFGQPHAFAPPPVIEQPRVFAPPPVVEEPRVVPPPPPPPVERIPAPIVHPVPAPPVPKPVVATEKATPSRSIGERTSELAETGGRFLKIAAAIVIVAGALAALGYGGWSYFSSVTAPGTLIVESAPPGAEVTIDGEKRGTTPLTLELPPGSHAITMSRRGLTRRFTVDVRPGEETTQTLDWSTVRAVGSLAVTTNPPGAKVSVDGRGYGVTPLTIPDLAAGRHRVVLEGPSGTVRREVTIEADGTTPLDEAIFSGWIAVFAPFELQILEGNRLLGTSENGRIMVPAGRYELTLVNKQLGARLTRSVEVEPGQVAAINITEVPATAAPPATAPPPDPQPQAEPPPQSQPQQD